MFEHLLEGPFLMFSKVVLFLTMMLCCIGGMGLEAFGQSPEAQEKYFKGLRQRSLFTTAEGICLRQLTRQDLSIEERQRLVIELARTYADHAASVSQQESELLWAQANQVLTGFIANYPQSPTLLIVETQAAILPALKADQHRRLYELIPNSVALKKNALNAANEAIERLIPYERRLENLVGLALRGKETGDEPIRRFQMKYLLQQVRFELGKAYINRARVLHENIVERSGAILSAENYLKAQAESWTDDPLTYQAIIQLAVSYRLNAEINKLDRLIGQSNSQSWKQNVIPELIAQKAHLLLDQDLPSEAEDLIKNYASGELTKEKKSLTITPHLRALRIQALLQMIPLVKKQGDSKLAEELQEVADKNGELLHGLTPGYWSQWAKLRLKTEAQKQTLGPALAKQIDTARSLYDNQKYTEATASYWAASQMAFQSELKSKGMELGQIAASIEVQNKQWTSAEKKLRTLIGQFEPTTAKNRDANARIHLLWAFALGQIASQQTSFESAAFKDYQTALEEHRKLFVEAATFGDATWMLAKLFDALGNSPNAIAFYKQVPKSHQRTSISRNRMAELVREAVSNKVENSDKMLASIIQFLDQEISENKLLDNDHFLVDVEQELLLNRASLELLNSKPNVLNLKVWLRTIQDANLKTPNIKVINQLIVLRLIIATFENNSDASLRLANDFKSLELSKQLELIPFYENSIQNLEQTSRYALVLQLIELIQAAKNQSAIAPATVQSLDERLVRAYISIDQSTNAIKMLDRILVRSPNNKQLLEWSAKLLKECGSDECLEKSVLRLRQLESKLKPGSQDWFETRADLAETLFQWKRIDDCKKLLKLTRLLYPDLGGGEIAKRLGKLQTQLANQ